MPIGAAHAEKEIQMTGSDLEIMPEVSFGG